MDYKNSSNEHKNSSNRHKNSSNGQKIAFKMDIIIVEMLT